jgi:serine/threonine-protein kinase
VAREVASFLESVAERARTAEVAAVAAQATAAAERRTRRRTIVLASALCLALTTGALLALIAERERRTRAEQSIAAVAAIYRKADWFRDQARRIAPDQLEIWGRALGQVRRTAEIVGAGAIDENTRKSVARLIAELQHEEESVRERARQYRAGQEKRTSESPSPPHQDQE